MISTELIIKWMNVIRHEKHNRDRILECFWDSQLKSKEWLCSELPKFENPISVVIHGAWYGTLAGMLLDSNNIAQIECVDIDPSCERYVRMFTMDDRVTSATCDMSEYKYTFFPDVVINTSCEHISDETYLSWYSKIPDGSIVVIQSNDMDHVEDHINCVYSIEQFLDKSGIRNPSYYGEKVMPNGNRRFMIIGEK